MALEQKLKMERKNMFDGQNYKTKKFYAEISWVING